MQTEVDPDVVNIAVIERDSSQPAKAESAEIDQRFQALDELEGGVRPAHLGDAGSNGSASSSSPLTIVPERLSSRRSFLRSRLARQRASTSIFRQEVSPTNFWFGSVRRLPAFAKSGTDAVIQDFSLATHSMRLLPGG